MEGLHGAVRALSRMHYSIASLSAGEHKERNNNDDDAILKTQSLSTIFSVVGLPVPSEG